MTLDPSGDTMRRWGARTFPTTFLVDRAGVIRHINRGWGAGYQARLLGLAARDARQHAASRRRDSRTPALRAGAATDAQSPRDSRTPALRAGAASAR